MRDQVIENLEPNESFVSVFESEAKVGELYKIFFANLIFSILTLGVFRFWARTRNRRYIFSHMKMLDDGFEYTGTGGELFKGFLFVFGLIILPFGILPAYYSNSLMMTDPETAQMIQGMQVLFFAALFPVAIFRAYKYLFSRVHWRGIHFAQVGATFGYWWRWISFSLLVPLTLGLILPLRHVVLSRYLVNHARFGNQSFEMDVSAKKLYPAFLLSYVLAVVSVGGAGLFIKLGFDEISTRFPSQNSGELPPEMQMIIAAVVVVGILGGMILAGFSMSVYYAKSISYFVSATRLNGCHFRANIKATRFVAFLVINFLISLVTFGMGYPFIVKRYMSFIAKYVEAQGLQSIEETIQIDRDELKTGEGLADALDVGVF